MRIVSLLPSATEMVDALGLSDQLVGVSHRCQWPPRVRELPVVTASALTAERTPAAVDAAIGRHKAAGRPLFQVNATLLQQLAPDVVLTQEVCEVCAVPADQARAACTVAAPGARMVTLRARRLADILANIALLGTELGADEPARHLLADMRRRLAALAQRLAGRPRVRVFAVEWLDPIKCTGAWLPDLIAAAGGESLIGEPGAKVREVPWAEVLAARPEAILIMPCGSSLERTRQQAVALAQRPGWADLPAVQDGRVYLVDGRICSRHGPRVVDGIEMLARLLHPGVLPGTVPPDQALSWRHAYGEGT